MVWEAVAPRAIAATVVSVMLPGVRSEHVWTEILLLAHYIRVSEPSYRISKMGRAKYSTWISPSLPTEIFVSSRIPFRIRRELPEWNLAVARTVVCVEEAGGTPTSVNLDFSTNGRPEDWWSVTLRQVALGYFAIG